MTDKQTIERLRQELCEYSRRCFNRGLVSGTGGNLSVRIPDSDKVLITGSGISMGDVEPEGILLVNLEEEVLEAAPGVIPSKETSFHLRTYGLRPEVGALAHVHPPYATAYSNKGKPLPMSTVSARGNLVQVPNVDCALPGSEELCKLVCSGLESYPDAKVILMKEHGILAMGKDLKTAYYLADLTEDTAKVAFIEANIPD